jgi:hypothetical protein
MAPEELRFILKTVYGRQYGANTKLAETLEVSKVTVARWMSTIKPVPIDNATTMLIRLMYNLHEQDKIKYMDKLKKPVIESL